MGKTRTKGMRRKALREVTSYDSHDTTEMIDTSKPLRFEDIGLRLPETPPTQVVSIRLPSRLLNDLRAIGSKDDIPYQALIKLFLAEAVDKRKKEAA